MEFIFHDHLWGLSLLSSLQQIFTELWQAQCWRLWMWQGVQNRLWHQEVCGFCHLFNRLLLRITYSVGILLSMPWGLSKGLWHPWCSLSYLSVLPTLSCNAGPMLVIYLPRVLLSWALSFLCIVSQTTGDLWLYITVISDLTDFLYFFNWLHLYPVFWDLHCETV